MPNLADLNKAALQYTISVTPRMKELAAPLQKYFGICSFSYMRIYNDCRYLSLLNGYEEFNKIYFENILQSDPHFIQAMQDATPNQPCFSLWPTDLKQLTPIFSLLDAYNIWHGFQITYRKADYCEMFSFTFDKQANDKKDFFIKNSLLLLKFADFFKNQAADIIDDQDKTRIAQFPKKFSISKESKDALVGANFLKELTKPILLKDANNKLVRLTKRETECFNLLIHNKTAKEIAHHLNISTRTVELHISNIKQKLGVNYKSQLLNLYKNFV